MEGVNQPNLLPQGSEITPLIDVANFLTETEVGNNGQFCC